MYHLGNVNHDSKGKEFGVTTVWFSDAKEDVPVSPARVRSCVPAYSRLLKCVCVFSSSFVQSMYRASSFFATITWWASSSSSVVVSGLAFLYTYRLGRP